GGDVLDGMFGLGREVDTHEHEREGDRHREETAPEQALLHPPAEERALPDEALLEDVAPGVPCERHDTAAETTLAEEPPSRPPVDASRWLLQPDRIVVRDAPGRE